MRVHEPEEKREATRRFWRWWSALTVSSAGDAVTTVALPLVAVTALGASTFEASMVVAARFAAWALIGLPAGVVVERFPLRQTQIAMDLVRALVLASVPVAALLDALTLPHVVAVSAAVGFAGVFFDIANASFLPSIVPEAELTARNSVTSSSIAATQLGGPAAGGVLIQAVGAVAAVVVDVVSYAVSAVLLAGLPSPPPRPRPAEGRGSLWRMIAVGLRYVAGHPVMRPSVLAATVVNLGAGGILALTAPYLVNTLGLGPEWVGFALAAEGAGSLAGAALAPVTARWWGSARTTVVVAVFGAVTVLLMPLAGSGWRVALFLVGNGLFAGAVVLNSVLWRTHRQTVTPPDLLPRVLATVRFVSWSAFPVGSLAAGGVATLVGDHAALWLSCAVVCVMPVVLLASRVRTLHDLVDDRPHSTG
jgi:MFS family permease